MCDIEETFWIAATDNFFSSYEKTNLTSETVLIILVIFTLTIRRTIFYINVLKMYKLEEL